MTILPNARRVVLLLIACLVAGLVATPGSALAAWGQATRQYVVVQAALPQATGTALVRPEPRPLTLPGLFHTAGILSGSLRNEGWPAPVELWRMLGEPQGSTVCLAGVAWRVRPPPASSSQLS